jgi:hypothetical protein
MLIVLWIFWVSITNLTPPLFIEVPVPSQEIKRSCIVVNEWLLFNPNSVIFQLYQVDFQWDDDEVRFVLDQHAYVDFHSASSLKQQSTDIHVAPLGHIILIQSQPLCLFSLMLRA